MAHLSHSDSVPFGPILIYIFFFIFFSQKIPVPERLRAVGVVRGDVGDVRPHALPQPLLLARLRDTVLVRRQTRQICTGKSKVRTETFVSA